MLAAKTALAAMLAWVLVWPLGGFIDDYPYYAPLGAVVAMSTTVVSSVRTSLQAVVAITLGSLVALAIHPLPIPLVAGLGLAMLVATLLAGWGWLGPMGSWVPTAALFALLLGSRHPVEYLAAYAGLVTLGALVGVTINLALPQLPLTPAARAAGQLREEVARQLDDLAEGLTAEEVLTAEDWSRRRWSLSARSRRVGDLIAIVREGQRANWRSRRWEAATTHQVRVADSLVRLSECVEDVADVVSDDRSSVHTDDDFSQGLRAVLAEAMSRVAAMLREAGPHDEGEEQDAAREAVRRAREHLARDPDQTPSHLASAAIVANLQRAVDAWT